MRCHVYRSSRKEGLYVYLPREDDFSSLPENLTKQLGQLELALTLELTQDSKLNREQPALVLDNLNKQGYHVQMPETLESLLKSHRSMQGVEEP